MNSANPYKTNVAMNRNAVTAGVLHATWHWVLTGCISGAVVPVALVANILYRESVYDASMLPGDRHCGLIVIASLAVKIFIVLFGVPICGMIGGLVGLVASKVFLRTQLGS